VLNNFASHFMRTETSSLPAATQCKSQTAQGSAYNSHHFVKLLNSYSFCKVTEIFSILSQLPSSQCLKTTNTIHLFLHCCTWTPPMTCFGRNAAQSVWGDSNSEALRAGCANILSSQMKLQSQNGNEGVTGKEKEKKKYASACTRCTLYTHVWVMFLRDGHFNISSDYSLNNKGCKRK